MLQPRIYFDTNEGTHEHGYALSLDQSRKDIAAIVKTAHEGMRVTVYMPDELEMDATLKFHHDYWIALPIPGTIKYLDGSD